MNIREMLEEQEQRLLCPFAAFSSQSKGRLRDDDACDLRPIFQHDRDRIIHCKSFRRLKHKTQVFLSPSGDHYRTRLTHTLEVSQIARTMAKALRLNEDLTEAIALGHDLGHTPFGHAGESVLNEIFPGGFRHEEQSLRVADVLEKDGQGLNLSYEVRDGILKHSKGDKGMFPAADDKPAETLEGQLVRLADTIAYVNHDIDDAVRAGIITIKDISQDCLKILGVSHSQRINTMVGDVIYASQPALPRLAMSREVLEATEELRRFLTQNVYYNVRNYGEIRKSSKVLRELYYHLSEHPEHIGKESFPQGDSRERAVCDFIAGMTDRYALQTYEDIFLPKPWLVV